MNKSSHFGVFKPLLFWLFAVAMAISVDVQANTYETFVSKDILTYGFSMTSLQGHNEVDPRKAITLEAVGLGVRLSKVELIDDAGKILFDAEDQTSLNLPTPLNFGSRYILKVTAGRPLLKQSETHEIDFTTVNVPKLEGPVLRVLEPDASVTLHFDHPVGEVQVTGDLTLSTKPDATGQNIRLLTSSFMRKTTVIRSS